MLYSLSGRIQFVATGNDAGIVPAKRFAATSDADGCRRMPTDADEARFTVRCYRADRDARMKV